VTGPDLNITPHNIDNTFSTLTTQNDNKIE
jgi:hypothetical protein